MRLIDIINAPWAIIPDRLTEIRSIYETHLKGEKIDIRPIEAALGRPLNSQPKGYEVVNGAAIIPIEGVIAKRMNLFTQISGGISTELLARDFKAALQDPSVKTIILSIDSPGGVVDGTADLAALIHGARGAKPIYAHTDGMMCSAAYWIGSAADKVFISNDTTSVGSIGVVTSHQDVSKMQERMGVKTTEIYAGKYKRIATEHEPLSEEGRASIQERVDHVYSVFVAAVAEHRGVKIEKVLSDMADGKVFSGKRAIEAGLVDGVSTLDALVADMSSGGVPEGRIQSKQTEGFMAIEKEKAAEKTSAACPSCGKELNCPDCDKPEEKTPAANIRRGIMEEGAKAERERIQGVYSLSRPGREKIIAEFMFDGKSTKADVAERILEADDAKREAHLKGLKEDGKDVKAVHADPGIGGNEAEGKGEGEFMTLVEAHQQAKNCTRGEAISAVAKAHPEAHANYLAGFQKK